MGYGDLVRSTVLTCGRFFVFCLAITYSTPLAVWAGGECGRGLEGWDLPGHSSGGLRNRSEPGRTDGGGGAEVQKVAMFAPSFRSSAVEYGRPKWTGLVPGPNTSAVGTFGALVSTI